jgi:hypothetical protein
MLQNAITAFNLAVKLLVAISAPCDVEALRIFFPVENGDRFSVLNNG